MWGIILCSLRYRLACGGVVGLAAAWSPVYVKGIGLLEQAKIPNVERLKQIR